MDKELRDLLLGVRECFVKTTDRGWWKHKDNDAEWIQVSEDLNDHLNDLDRLLGPDL